MNTDALIWVHCELISRCTTLDELNHRGQRIKLDRESFPGEWSEDVAEVIRDFYLRQRNLITQDPTDETATH